MKVFVTGAGGFIGKAVVIAAAAAGHSVMAMYRPGSQSAVLEFPDGVQPVPGDLRQSGTWCEALREADAIIHCAVAFDSVADSVLGTENLLAATPARLARFVHVSSVVVYDFGAPRWLGTFDEQTPLEKEPGRRDAYTRLKIRQEELIGDFCRKRGIPLVVTRPVAVYGANRNWQFGRAKKLGPFDLIAGAFSTLRLIHVDDCASAHVAALTADLDGREAIAVNLISDDLCSHWSFHRQARRLGARTGFAIPVPYLLLRALGWAAFTANKLAFSGRKRLPKVLDPAHQVIAWRPLRYSNKAAKSLLGWQPRVALRSGIKELADHQRSANRP